VSLLAPPQNVANAASKINERRQTEPRRESVFSGRQGSPTPLSIGRETRLERVPPPPDLTVFQGPKHGNPLCSRQFLVSRPTGNSRGQYLSQRLTIINTCIIIGTVALLKCRGRACLTAEGDGLSYCRSRLLSPQWLAG